MNEIVHKIVPSRLLFENISEELAHKNMLRKMFRQDDIIWQQMKWEHFEGLITSNSLYFKAYGEYGDYDEKKLKDYCHSDLIDKAKLNDMLSEIEKHLFISCWYNSKDLSDVVFSQYADKGSGIAIGISVDKLIESLKRIQNIENYKFYVGNIQYLPQRYLDKEILFEDAQYIVPVFLKGMQSKMDNEFRICTYTEEHKQHYNSDKRRDEIDLVTSEYTKLLSNLMESEKFDINSIGIIAKNLKEYFSKDSDVYSINIPIQNLNELIDYIAIKSDSVFAHVDKQKIKTFFEKKFKLYLKETEEISSSGFEVFSVER